MSNVIKNPIKSKLKKAAAVAALSGAVLGGAAVATAAPASAAINNDFRYFCGLSGGSYSTFGHSQFCIYSDGTILWALY